MRYFTHRLKASTLKALKILLFARREEKREKKKRATAVAPLCLSVVYTTNQTTQSQEKRKKRYHLLVHPHTLFGEPPFSFIIIISSLARLLFFCSSVGTAPFGKSEGKTKTKPKNTNNDPKASLLHKKADRRALSRKKKKK
jgi:hypothetical protein